MRKRLLVLLTTVALAVSSLPVGVCADTDINMDEIGAAENNISAKVVDEDLVGTQSRADHFAGGYNLTGDGATDIVNVALAQKGRRKADFGYTEAWCADFASDCAQIAGQSGAVPANGRCDYFRNNIINAGGSVVSKQNARPGDIVFYDWDGAVTSHDHVEIVYGNSGGIISSIGGNTSTSTISGGVVGTHSNSYTTGRILEIVRPNYSSTNLSSTPSLSGQSVPPAELKKGTAFNVRGIVSCRNPISTIHVYVFDDYGSCITGRSVHPNATSYDLKNVDYDVKFSKLSAGSYEYKITAIVNGTEYLLLSKWFYVTDGSAAPTATPTATPIPTQAPILSGDCSQSSKDSVKWRVQKANGKLKLVISGKGKMTNFRHGEEVIPLTTSIHNELHKLPEFENEYIREIEICEGVTSIGNSAFQDAKEVEQVYLSNGLTEISMHAFMDCSNLTEMIIPNSVSRIGMAAFYGCSSLKKINIPDGVNSIADGEFEGCSSLKELNIPKNVTSIGIDAFRDCIGLEKIILSEGLRSIEVDAFQGCSSLKEISIPESVSTIGGGAFFQCSGLEKIGISNGVSSIGNYIFDDCSSLKEIYYDGTREDWDKIDKNSDYYNEFIEDNNITIYFMRLENPTATATPMPISTVILSGDCSKTSEDNVKWQVIKKDDGNLKLIISGKGEMEGYRTTNVLEDTLITNIHNKLHKLPGFESEDIKEIEVCEGVESIGKNAFDEGTSIETIKIPKSVKAIEAYAFYCCNSLKEIIIPNSVTEIDNGVFSGCSSLEKITIPDSVTSIGGSAFAGCSGLKKITIPNSVTSIGAGAFERCSGLEEITIPDSVTAIKSFTFSTCDGLKKITIPDSVTSIGSNAFWRCSGLEEITIPDSVTAIEWGAFSGCSSLKEIIIPDSVASIGDSIFFDCSGLEEITIPESWTAIGYCTFYNCNGLKKITIPDSVTSIGSSAFAKCSGLEEITIPDGVTSIGSSAFAECSGLKEITIPDSVTSIGESAFSGCSSLKEISIPNGIKEIYASVWANCTNLKNIYLPHSLEQFYAFAKLKPRTGYEDPVFAYGTSLTDIYYNGTKEEWNKIDKYRPHFEQRGDGVVMQKGWDETDDDFLGKEITIHFLKSEVPTSTPIPTSTPKPTATPIPTSTPKPTATPTSVAAKITSQICGTGLSLKGKIGANVLLGFTDNKAVEDMDPSVIVNVDGKENVLKLSDQEHYTSGKKEIYEIQTYVPAKQINEKIDLKLIGKNGNTITLRYGKKNLSSFTFSVSEITDSYLTNYEQYGEKTIDLVTAIQNYCGYAQLMTGYKTNTAKITDKLLYISAKDLKPYATVVDKGSKIAKYAGTGLALQSDTTMQIYFKLADNVDAYTITLDGEAVTPEDCGSGIYCVELKSIPAGKLSTASEIVISKSGETFTIKASALSWAESVLSNTKGQKQTTIDMAKMLYRYSQKADAYFAKK